MGHYKEISTRKKVKLKKYGKRGGRRVLKCQGFARFSAITCMFQLYAPVKTCLIDFSDLIPCFICNICKYTFPTTTYLIIYCIFSYYI